MIRGPGRGGASGLFAVGARMVGVEALRRRAFEYYLRTGRRLRFEVPDGVEFKFNPYHDPRNGQFTFAPGGPRSLDNIVVSDRRGQVFWMRGEEPGMPAAQTGSQLGGPSEATTRDAVHEVGVESMRLQSAQYRPRLPGRARGNIESFHDPMTLQQVFPGLNQAPGGAIVGVADALFDLRGPAVNLTTALALQRANFLESQIKAVDPTVRFLPGFPSTGEGQATYLNGLLFQRAAVLYRVRGDPQALQLETLRFLHRETDRAYAEALQRLGRGELRVNLSSQEAVGNFVDRRVRVALRGLYNQYRISTVKGSEVRVNGREYDSSGTDRTHRRPDARVGNVAFDVTLTRKTDKTAQVRGFFSSDFKPKQVIIVRPSQFGRDTIYAVTAPEVSR